MRGFCISKYVKKLRVFYRNKLLDDFLDTKFNVRPYPIKEHSYTNLLNNL